MAKKMKQKKTAGRRRRGGGSTAFAAAGPGCMMPAPTRQLYRFERTLYAGNLTSTAADKGWGFTSTLGSFPGSAEFTALFDLYRMTALEYTFSIGGTSGGGWDPTLAFFADYDSYVIPTTLDAVGQRPHKRVTLSAANPVYTFKLRPRVMSIVQTSSGTGSAGLASQGLFLDCNQSDVVYGGLLGWITNFNIGTGLQISLTVRAKFDMAMVR